MSETLLVIFPSYIPNLKKKEREKVVGDLNAGRKLPFLSVILFGQWGCHIINTWPRTWELLLCTHSHSLPPPCHEMTSIHSCHMQNTHSKAAGKWDMILFFFSEHKNVLFYPYWICKTLFFYFCSATADNSATENLSLSGDTAHCWHSLSSMSTAGQVWMTLHTLYLERKSLAQQPDYFWSLLHHCKLYSEQKASAFSLAFFLTSLHLDFS